MTTSCILAKANRQVLGKLRDLIDPRTCPHSESDLNQDIERVELFSPKESIKITVCSLGATIESIKLQANMEMVYTEENWFGKTSGYNGRSCGRMAGRTHNYKVAGRRGSRTTNAQHTGVETDEEFESKLDETNSESLLHGGRVGLSFRVWHLVNTFCSQNSARAVFEVETDHMDQGHPGKFKAEVHIMATEDHMGIPRLDIRYRAKLAEDSPCLALVNLTSHCYFNLSGFSGNSDKDSSETRNSNSLAHQLHLPKATRYLPQFLSTELALTSDNPDFNFTAGPRKIGKPLDHYFLCVEPSSFAENTASCEFDSKVMTTSATLISPDSKVKMHVTSTCPGLQIYTGQHCDFRGVCMEFQYPPPSAEMPEFVSKITLEGKSLPSQNSPIRRLLSSNRMLGRRGSFNQNYEYEFDELTMHEFHLF